MYFAQVGNDGKCFTCYVLEDSKILYKSESEKGVNMFCENWNREKNEILKLINKEMSPFNLSMVKDVLKLITNKEMAIRDIHSYIYDKYPNEYICICCNEWKNECKLNKTYYENCNDTYEKTKLKINYIGAK